MCILIIFCYNKRLTIEERVDLPDGDRSLGAELAEGELEEEQGQTSNHQHYQVGNEERPCSHTCMRLLSVDQLTSNLLMW